MAEGMTTGLPVHCGPEPNIVINGVQLTDAQAMALRCAAGWMFMEMGDPEALGTDEHGRTMTAGYRARLDEILRTMSGKGSGK